MIRVIERKEKERNQCWRNDLRLNWISECFNVSKKDEIEREREREREREKEREIR